MTSAQAAAMAAAAVAQFDAWYDTAAITDWATQLAQQIQALQRSLARTTDAYLARALSMTTGRRVEPIGAVDITNLRGGDVTPAGAYGRAADVFRWQQSQFDAIARSLLTDKPRTPDIVDPVQAAADRAAAAADYDTQLAVRKQENAVLTRAGAQGLITGYRRVIHPELSAGHTCGLCVAASDRLYGPHEPRPIHRRCHCAVLPVVDGLDPGSALNQRDLGRLYEDAGGQGRQKLAATRYQIDEHGELGPVLNPAGAKVRTARQAKKDENRPPRREKTLAERRADLERVRGELKASLPKAADRASQDPATWGPFLQRLNARVRSLDEQLAA